MHTESIQNPPVPGSAEAAERAERWQHVSSAFGLPLTQDQLADLALLDDRAAVAHLLPHLLDVERDEVLWAVAARAGCLCA